MEGGSAHVPPVLVGLATMTRQAPTAGRRTDDIGRAVDSPGLPAGIALLWLLVAVEAAAVLVVYWRTPAAELYHVTHSGPAEGARRLLSFAGYPSALVAAAIALLVADRLPARATVAAALGSLALGASALWAGSSDEADVDARPVSVAALTGLAIAVAMTVLLVRARGLERPRRLPGDRARIVAGLVVLVLALPWLAALLGVSLDRVPLLGWVFITDAKVTQPGNLTPAPAVHDGHHHGLDGATLVWAALILSRELDRFRSRGLRTAMCALLAFFFAYGGWNLAQDFWLEQVVKRGATSVELPYVIAPAVTAAWGLVVVIAVAAFVALRRGRLPAPLPS
jgi:hypothetical protein